MICACWSNFTLFIWWKLFANWHIPDMPTDQNSTLTNYKEAQIKQQKFVAELQVSESIQECLTFCSSRATMACYKAGRQSSSPSLPAHCPRTMEGSRSSSSASSATSSSTSPSSSTAGSCTNWRQNTCCLSACKISLAETLSSPLASIPYLWIKLNLRLGQEGCPSFRWLLLWSVSSQFS